MKNRGELIGADCLHPTRGFFASPKSGLVYLEAGGATVTPYALNDQSEVAGDSSVGAFYWSAKEGFINIRSRIGAVQASAFAINNDGLVLGAMTNVWGADFFYLWDVKRGLRYTIPRGPSCEARLTESGKLLGTCGTSVWTWSPKAGVRDAGTLGPEAVVYGWNGEGRLVGQFRPAPGAALHAFVWSEETGTIDLDPGSPSRISVAKFINRDGVIAGEFIVDADFFTSSAAACIWKPARQ